jgi:hypothetical protein
MTRSPIAKYSKKRRKSLPARAACMRIVRERSRGMCECPAVGSKPRLHPPGHGELRT